MGSEEKFCLRWNDFESSLSWSFQQFRSQLQDVHIICGSRCTGGLDLEQIAPALHTCNVKYKPINLKKKHIHTKLRT